ncbi:uncharacterized protein [Dermacentor andersoni]|uniref:uncharacterized protein n=1 Tax=Dermacentor andersoni TaxID=34620 RepID=UPI0021551234|nr:heparan sulfate glucosamine 3-O-sulfotransferase 3B1-like [Dermacentor andersoni]
MPVTRVCGRQWCHLLCYCLVLALGTGAASSLAMIRKQTTLNDRADDVDSTDVAASSYETAAEDPVGHRQNGKKINRQEDRSSDFEKLEKRLPSALIIGVKKAGTRALLEFLRLHPDVRATGPETHFFDRHYNKGIEWYRLQMPLTLQEQITMEKTPSYFVTEEVPARIRSTLPQARLLVVVRDPVTRALSDYAQTASKRPDTTLPFEVLAFRRRRRRRGGDTNSNIRHQSPRRRRARSRNDTFSGGRNVTTPGSSKIEFPAAPRYNKREGVKERFLGRLNGRDSSQRGHITADTYHGKNTEDREVTIRSSEATRNDEQSYVSYRPNGTPTHEYASLNTTKDYNRARLVASDPHQENSRSSGNEISDGIVYSKTKKKGASSSSRGRWTDAASADEKRAYKEDTDQKSTGRDCGQVRYSVNSTCTNGSSDVDESWSGIRIGLYANHLTHWLRHFPQSQIHVVSGEELVRNPAREMAMVQDFLGLRRLVSEDHFYFNRTKGFPCLKKSEGSGSPHCLGKTKGRTHPRLSEESIRRLRKFFEPHNRKFYKLVGRDFEWECPR